MNRSSNEDLFRQIGLVLTWILQDLSSDTWSSVTPSLLINHEMKCFVLDFVMYNLV